MHPGQTGAGWLAVGWDGGHEGREEGMALMGRWRKATAAGPGNLNNREGGREAVTGCTHIKFTTFMPPTDLSWGVIILLG